MRPRLTVTELLDSLDGLEVEGGCGDCNAIQRFERVPGYSRITRLVVVHDDSCPALARRTGRW
jgi:hypothetical protein